MKISAKSQYGLRAMVYLVKHKNKISSLREISENEGIPFDYLEKIISKMEKAGLVKSKKGVQGGYFLARTAEKITLGEIMRALEGKMALVRCIDEDKEKVFHCPKKNICLTKNAWTRIQGILTKALNSITLTDLISNKK